MMTEERKAELTKAGIRLHNLMDYHVEHRTDMQLHQYFFLKDSRPNVYLNGRTHLAILTWYAMMRKETTGDFRKGPLHLGHKDIVYFDELTGHHHTFFEGMIAGKILLEIEKGDMGSAYILGRTQDNPGFDLAEGDDMPFYLPMTFEECYIGVDSVDVGFEQVYSPYSTAPTGSVSLNVHETYKL